MSLPHVTRLEREKEASESVKSCHVQQEESLRSPHRCKGLPVHPQRSVEPGARAMPPLTGVGERCAPRATWFCIDERTRRQVALARAESTHPCQGSGLAASLAPCACHEPHGSTPTEPQAPRDA